MKKIFLSLPLFLSVLALSFSPFVSNDAMAAIHEHQNQGLERSHHHHSKSWCRVVCKWKHGQKVCYKECIKCRNFHCERYRVPLLR